MNDIENILILGCDVAHEVYETRNKLTEKEKNMRSDTILIVSLNKNKRRIKLIGLDRDIWVDIPGYGKGKLNSPMVYGGPELAMQVINDCFRLDIKSYVQTNIVDMIDIMDLFGGLDIDLTDMEAEYINDWIADLKIASSRDDDVPELESGGRRYLNGMQIVAHARNRTIDPDLYVRSIRTNQILYEIADKAKNKMNVIQIILFAIRALKYVHTNIGIADMLRLICFGLKSDLNNIDTYYVPEEGMYEIKTDRIWRIELDFDKTSQKIHDYLQTE